MTKLVSWEVKKMDYEKEIEQIKRRLALWDEKNKYTNRSIRALALAVAINTVNLILLAIRLM